MTLTLYVPIIRNNREGLASTNPLVLMLTQEAAFRYLLSHAQICQSHDELTYRIACYELLESQEQLICIRQLHYQVRYIQGEVSLIEIKPKISQQETS